MAPSPSFGEALAAAGAIFGVLFVAGVSFRTGWTFAGHHLYRVGFRDVCSQTTINNHGTVVVNGEERKA